MKKLSKLISIVLAIVMCLTLCPQAAFAADLTTDGGNATTPVVLNVTPAIFSVTVPTGLPITMTADGQIETADSAKIINNSAGSVKVANVAVEGQNDWAIVDFGTDPTTFKVDEKKVGLQINTMAEITADDGTFAFDATKWGVMTATDGQDGGDDEYEFTYDAIVAPQSNAVTDTTVANVVFTIGWYKAESIVSDGHANCAEGHVADDGEIQCTWEEISTGDAISSYSLGNYKTVSTEDYGNIQMQIVAFNADTKSDGSGTAAISWISKDIIALRSMNTTNINTGGWASSEMRSWLRSDVFSALPMEIQNSIIEVNKTYYNKTTKSTLSIEDTLWIPSQYEIFGTNDGYGCEDSGILYTEVFSNNNSTIKYYNGSSNPWWLRSAVALEIPGFFRAANTTSGIGAAGASVATNGVVLGFCT